MFEVQETVVIARDPEEVFDVAVDPEKQLEWDAGNLKRVEKLTPEPLGRGSRFRGTFKGFGTVEYEYDELDRPRRFSHRANLPVGGAHHLFELAPAEGGTRLTQTIVATPKGLGKLVTPVMKPMIKRRIRTINAELKVHLER
jgi:uncharacterized protein YndB with AHSA1/START domain